MRAMILAAGFGTRMRPVTLSVPKPLVPIANRPILEYTFALLAAAGVREVVVNAHHLAERLQEGLRRLDASGIDVHCSVERRILGTAGGVKKAGAFLAGGTFLLLNGDFLIDIDLRRVLDFHREQQAMATMVLVPDKPAGVISVDPAGVIRRFIAPAEDEPGHWVRTGFTGVHVLEPEVLRLIPASKPWEINRQVYPEMLARGRRVCGYVHEGYWREAGSPAGYLAANLEVLTGTAGGIAPRAGAGGDCLAGARCAAPLLVGEGVRAGRAVLPREAPAAVPAPEASPGMRRYLIGIDLVGCVHEVTRHRVNIGRTHDNDLRIVDLTVSRLHAMLTVRNGEAVVVDANSRNGVFVNGIQVRYAKLEDGDLLTFGTVRFRYRVGTGVSGGVYATA